MRGSYDLLTALAVCAFTVCALYFGRELLVPLALAVMLSFVLTPLTLKLRGWGVGRSTAVVLVVTFAFLIIAGLGIVIGRQVTELAESLPRYQTTLLQKVKDIRPAPQAGGFMERATDAFKRLTDELKPPPEAPPSGPQQAGPPPAAQPPQPIPVEVQEPPRRPLDYARDVAGALLHPLATAGLVLVFVVFILLQREDLRDPVIRLLGGNNLERTTAAITEAADRLSRLFLTYTVLNAAYGTFIALALWLIGVPSPALWGILAGLMRFVPFVGSIIAGAMPVMLAAAVYPGWSPALLTLALFVASEAVMGQVMEPWLLGRATGLSPLAAIVCVSFWAWLWGPVGLVLAIPMTVCLIVLGRHVEQMSFLYVLLGDEPALTPAQGFYQRLLTGDTAEIIHQAERCLKEISLVTYMDTVALPGLLLAQEDVRRGRFTTERLREMEEAIEEVIDEFDELEPPDGQGKAPEQEQDDGKGSEPPPLPVLDPDRLRPEWRTPAPVLCIGVRNPLDRAAARILALLASKHGLSCRVVGPEAVGPAAIAALDLKDTQMAVLSYLDAMAGPAYAKYLLRRLRRRKPKLGVILGFWGESRYSTPEFAADVDGEARQAGTFREALVALLDAAAKRDEAQSPPRPTPIQADGPRSAPTPVERPEPAT